MDMMVFGNNQFTKIADKNVDLELFFSFFINFQEFCSVL